MIFHPIPDLPLVSLVYNHYSSPRFAMKGGDIDRRGRLDYLETG